MNNFLLFECANVRASETHRNNISIESDDPTVSICIYTKIIYILIQVRWIDEWNI